MDHNAKRRVRGIQQDLDIDWLEWSRLSLTFCGSGSNDPRLLLVLTFGICSNISFTRLRSLEKGIVVSEDCGVRQMLNRNTFQK